MKLLILAMSCFALSGCVVVKEATVTEATINTAGWKSQAGVGSDAVIEATTTPKTDVSATGL